MRASPLRISQMLACVLLPLAAMPSHAAGVVISQVYGGGGNSGATLKNDFIELFNAGASAAYTLAPVPEPKGTAMLLAGIALLGLMARRRV